IFGLTATGRSPGPAKCHEHWQIRLSSSAIRIRGLVRTQEALRVVQGCPVAARATGEPLRRVESPTDLFDERHRQPDAIRLDFTTPKRRLRRHLPELFLRVCALEE